VAVGGSRWPAKALENTQSHSHVQQKENKAWLFFRPSWGLLRWTWWLSMVVEVLGVVFTVGWCQKHGWKGMESQAEYTRSNRAHSAG